MNGKRAPGHFYCHVCSLTARQGDDGLENKRWAAAYFQPGTGRPPSQKAEQWYRFLPEPLSELSQAAETKLDTTASHKSSAKGNIAYFPHPIPPPLLCVLITLPLTSGGKKKEKNGFQLAGQSFFSLLAQQVPPSPTCWDLKLSYSPNPSPPSSLPLQHLPNMPLHSLVQKSMTETTGSVWVKHEVAQVRDGESSQVSKLWSSTGWGGVRAGTNQQCSSNQQWRVQGFCKRQLTSPILGVHSPSLSL